MYRTSEQGTDMRNINLEKELEMTKAELADLKTERVKIMKAMQAFVKQNKSLSKDIERLKNKSDNTSDETSEKREVNARRWVTSRQDLSGRAIDSLSIS